MKKSMILSTLVFIFFVTLYAAEPKNPQTSSAWQGTEIHPEKEEPGKKGVSELPCFITDDTDFFACMGVHNGHKNQNKEEVKAFALAQAIYACHSKMSHAVRALANEYSQKSGVKKEDGFWIKADEDSVNFLAVSETAQVSCAKYSIKDGIVTAYVGIKVPRKDLSEKVKEIEKRGK